MILVDSWTSFENLTNFTTTVIFQRVSNTADGNEDGQLSDDGEIFQAPAINATGRQNELTFLSPSSMIFPIEIQFLSSNIGTTISIFALIVYYHLQPIHHGRI